MSSRPWFLTLAGHFCVHEFVTSKIDHCCSELAHLPSGIQNTSTGSFGLLSDLLAIFLNMPWFLPTCVMSCTGLLPCNTSLVGMPRYNSLSTNHSGHLAKAGLATHKQHNRHEWLRNHNMDTQRTTQNLENTMQVVKLNTSSDKQFVL